MYEVQLFHSGPDKKSRGMRLFHSSPFYSVAENLRSNSLKSQNVRHDIFDGEESSISMVWKHLISNYVFSSRCSGSNGRWQTKLRYFELAAAVFFECVH
jgi:hypothetical protein